MSDPADFAGGGAVLPARILVFAWHIRTDAILENAFCSLFSQILKFLLRTDVDGKRAVSLPRDEMRGRRDPNA
jgi:hypothetical protein